MPVTSGAHHPYGTQFFRFHIHFHRKAPASGVHAPLQEILDPPLFDIDIGLDSDSDNSILLTQQPSQARRGADLNQSIDEIDLENILNSTKDSALNGDSSLEKILSTQNVIEKLDAEYSDAQPRTVPYRPQV